MKWSVHFIWFIATYNNAQFSRKVEKSQFSFMRQNRKKIDFRMLLFFWSVTFSIETPIEFWNFIPNKSLILFYYFFFRFSWPVEE